MQDSTERTERQAIARFPRKISQPHVPAKPKDQTACPEARGSLENDFPRYVHAWTPATFHSPSNFLSRIAFLGTSGETRDPRERSNAIKGIAGFVEHATRRFEWTSSSRNYQSGYVLAGKKRTDRPMERARRREREGERASRRRGNTGETGGNRGWKALNGTNCNGR